MTASSGDDVVGARLHHDGDPRACLVRREQVTAGEGIVALAGLRSPLVSPVLAFVLARPLAGPSPTAADVVQATGSVCAALEVVDGGELVHVVLGPVALAPVGVDLSLIGVLVERGRDLVTTAAGAAALGNPAHAVAVLLELPPARQACFGAGAVLLSGALTAPVPLDGGCAVSATFGRLGAVGVRAA